MTRTDRLAKQLVDACFELLSRAPWNVVDAEAFFLMAVPTEQHPLAVSITGREGIEMGLTLSRGADGLARIMRTLLMDGPDGHSPESVREQWDHIGLTLEPLGDIPRRFRGLLERAGFSGRREKQAPLVYGRRAFQGASAPTRQEMRTLLWCLAGVFAALDAGTMKPSPIARGKSVLRFDVTGSMLRPDVQVGIVPWEEALGGEDLLTDVYIPGDVEPSPLELDVLPVEDPATLDEWKLADRHFIACMNARILTDGSIQSKRALRRYFGDEVVAESVLNDLRNLCPHIAFVEWLATDYRSTYRSKTWLEKLVLREDTPAVHRAIAQARCAGEHSIYRIDATTPGSTLEVEDIFSGRRSIVHDALLSNSAPVGTFVPLRLMQLGDWVCPILAGPPLTGFQIDGALRELERQGLPPSVTSLRDFAEPAGHLWAWFMECCSDRGMPQLQNTDGDPLLWHRAHFKVAAPEALVTALEDRSDVVCAEAGSAWSWLRRGTSVGGVGDDLSLCRLEVLGDELCVEANSARRMANARTWVDELPGVEFLSQSTTDIGDEAASRPLDDRLPRPPEEPMSPELVAEVGRLMEKQQRAWLDEPVPMLGGKTPRQACADPDGRKIVERLIRTMPASGYPGGEIQPPRQALLDELGLGAESG